jgi:hypothetical protein
MTDQPQDGVRVTDKRGKAKAKDEEMPTAQQLLDEPPADNRDPAETEFDRQRREAEEDARRAAEFEALPEEEKQRILAEQAKDVSGIPYQGAGVQNEEDADVKEIMSAFAIVIDLDGTATAMPLDIYNKNKWRQQRDINPRMMYRASAEIMMDVQAAETGNLTVQIMNVVGQQMAEQQRAAAIQQQLAQRGMKPPGRAR